MRTDGLLTLLQWVSPAFPTGGFAYSHGLEAAVAAGRIQDAHDLELWLSDVLQHGSGRTDAIWLRLAFDATPDELTGLDAQARAYQTAATRLRESAKQGAAFVKTVNAVWGLDLPDLLLPLAVGAAAKAQRLDLDEVVAAYLHAMMTNLVAAAQRLAPVGQTEGQRVLYAIAPLCNTVAEATRSASPDDLHSIAFVSDIMAMQHETLETRIFQS